MCIPLKTFRRKPLNITISKSTQKSVRKLATFSVKVRQRSLQAPEKESYKAALAFSKLLNKEFGDFLKAVVLFGSCAKNETTKQSDIDVLIIVDDVGRIITPEVTEAYRLIV